MLTFGSRQKRMEEKNSSGGEELAADEVEASRVGQAIANMVAFEVLADDSDMDSNQEGSEYSVAESTSQLLPEEKIPEQFDEERLTAYLHSLEPTLNKVKESNKPLEYYEAKKLICELASFAHISDRFVIRQTYLNRLEKADHSSESLQEKFINPLKWQIVAANEIAIKQEKRVGKIQANFKQGASIEERGRAIGSAQARRLGGLKVEVDSDSETVPVGCYSMPSSERYLNSPLGAHGVFAGSWLPDSNVTEAQSSTSTPSLTMRRGSGASTD